MQLGTFTGNRTNQNFKIVHSADRYLKTANNMKLSSGHEIVKEDKDEDSQKNFKAHKAVGSITLKPGNWFLLKTFTNYADRIYTFPVRIKKNS